MGGLRVFLIIRDLIKSLLLLFTNSAFSCEPQGKKVFQRNWKISETFRKVHPDVEELKSKV